jgi:hypothetical protein
MEKHFLSLKKKILPATFSPPDVRFKGSILVHRCGGTIDFFKSIFFGVRHFLPRSKKFALKAVAEYSIGINIIFG